jgi:hypothetical protein
MRTPVNLVLVCLTLILLAPQPARAWAPVSTPRGPVLDKETQAKVRELLVKRRDALKKEVKARTQEFEAGRGTLDILLGASKRLLKAELELADKQAQRVAAHKAHLDAIKKIAALTEAGYDAGRVKEADHQQAVAARLGAEIGWLRAGGKEKKPAK